jgi:hypothetical protein
MFGCTSLMKEMLIPVPVAQGCFSRLLDALLVTAIAQGFDNPAIAYLQPGG